MTQRESSNTAAAAMHALALRAREIESDEREAASALILGTCAGHGLAYCDQEPRCVGPLVAPSGSGVAYYCGGAGQAAVACESVEAFAAAQKSKGA